MDQRAKAEALRDLHVPGDPLLLLNAWDAASAVVIARGGARAIATSSAAAANALGYADGQHLTREQMLGAVARDRRRRRPAGHGRHGGRLRRRARCRRSDRTRRRRGRGGRAQHRGPARRRRRRCSRSSASWPRSPRCARSATRPAFRSSSTPAPTSSSARSATRDTRLEHAVERGRAYLDAGADCIFVPGGRRSGA